MNLLDRLELFILKCAVIEKEVRAIAPERTPESIGHPLAFGDERLDALVKQFDGDIRDNAQRMSIYYQIFYMLENDIRRLIEDTLSEAHGVNWWTDMVPQPIREEAQKNQRREEQAGVSPRSEKQIDYITFGQLSEIFSHNWDSFAGMLSDKAAVSRVLASLNMLRGTIAHCGVLAEDEADRLKLAIRDWFRVLEGPRRS